jgi:hypothetical protein
MSKRARESTPTERTPFAAHLAHPFYKEKLFRSLACSRASERQHGSLQRLTLPTPSTRSTLTYASSASSSGCRTCHPSPPLPPTHRRTVHVPTRQVQLYLRETGEVVPLPALPIPLFPLLSQLYRHAPSPRTTTCARTRARARNRTRQKQIDEYSQADSRCCCGRRGIISLTRDRPRPLCLNAQPATTTDSNPCLWEARVRVFGLLSLQPPDTNPDHARRRARELLRAHTHSRTRQEQTVAHALGNHR